MTFQLGTLVGNVSDKLYDICLNWRTVSDEDVKRFKVEFGKAISLDNPTKYGFSCEMKWMTDPSAKLRMPLDVKIFTTTNGERLYYNLDANGGVSLPIDDY
jgi:hypothetical protein